jgi:hypothetical protein
MIYSYWVTCHLCGIVDHPCPSCGEQTLFVRDHYAHDPGGVRARSRAYGWPPKPAEAAPLRATMLALVDQIPEAEADYYS